MASPAHISDLQYIRGVGPKRAEALAELGIHSVRDLLYTFPRSYLDRSTIVPVADLRKHLQSRTPVTVVARVVKQSARKSKSSSRVIFLLTVADDSGPLTCVWFEGFQWLKEAFTEGELLALSAFPALDKSRRLQFAHPQFDRLGSAEDDEPDWGKLFNTGSIVPNYRSGADLARIGLDSRGFRRILRHAVAKAAGVPETLDESIVKRQGLMPLQRALAAMHFPGSWDELRTARERIKFDELFYLNLMITLRRAHQTAPGGRSFAGPSPLRDRLLASLPFALTEAQKKVLAEIDADLASPAAMHRLLQGDVGSGKTIVALLSALRVVDAGAQVAFMAPTEVLAEQHARTLRFLAGPLGVNVRLLTGSRKKKLREDVLADIRRGTAQIAVGTHALLEETVVFSDLGLVIIDEQHRFGVSQRASLRSKGTSPELLVMTATPIPRTLAMTLYGDLDVSTIDAMPADRRPVRTGIRTPDQADKAFAFIRDEVGRGRQAYIIFPLIEQSEKVDLKAATEEFERLSRGPFRDLRVGLLHGRMASDAKDGVMAEFAGGRLDILVSTTVIEVGIDVPNATVMLIEHAERFGLSQLHQLRGRVGRGADQSYCILMSDPEVFRKRLKGMDEEGKRMEEAKAERRLRTMAETTDGFKIAEVDLELRGPGDFFGTRQSGLPGLTLADLVLDRDLFDRSRVQAVRVVDADTHLRLPDHRHIRTTFESYYHHLFRLGSVS